MEFPKCGEIGTNFETLHNIPKIEKSQRRRPLRNQEEGVVTRMYGKRIAQMVSKLAPPYLCNLCPAFVSERS